MQKKLKNNKGLLDIETIQGMLPHRYPFLLVDRVLKMEVGKSLIAIKNVTCNEPFFQGHFPSIKLMPGVLIIEALAQAGGILLYNSIPDADKKIVLLSKIDNAKFRRPAVPGDQLILDIDLLKLKNRICHVRGKALIDDEIAVECDILASPLDIETLNEQR